MRRVEYICEWDKGYFGAVSGEPEIKEELIRCKDCERNPKISLVGCPLADIWGRTDDDYCSRAERKENG